MKKRILIKEIDKLTSRFHKKRIISEYLIYVIGSQDNNETILEAYNEIGYTAKNFRVNELILNHFNEYNFNEYANIPIEHKNILNN
jgi:hypothetical protein